RNSCLQQFLDQAEYPAIRHAMLDELHRPFVTHRTEEISNVCVENPIHTLPMNTHRQRIQRPMRATLGTEPIRKAFEVDLVDFIEDCHHSLLNDLVLQSCDAQ